MIKECTICGASFEVRHNEKTCSKVCRTARKRAVKRAEKARYRRRHPEKLRAQKARYKARKRAEHLAANPDIAERVRERERSVKTERGPTLRRCVECGSEFPARANVKTCSQACWRRRFERQRLAREGKRHKRPWVPNRDAHRARKREAQNTRNAEARAALRLLQEIRDKGLEALL